MNTQPTPEKDKFFATFADGEAAPSHAEYYARLQDLERERDEARAYADKLAEGLPDGMLPKDVEVLREANLGLATELTTVTAQRDRLAVALQKLRNNESMSLGGAAYEILEQALQSLTPKP
jgi:hypothetical protein